MKQSELEQKLKSAKFYHLTEDELLAYRDRELDEVGLSRAEAHLKLCLVCERGLALLREELAALENIEITAEDVALVERVMQEARSRRPVDSRLPEASGVPVSDRLAAYLRQLTDSLQAYFLAMTPVRDAVPPGQEIRSQPSDDGLVSVTITLEDTSDLTIHLSSSERGFAGQRVRVSLGTFSGEATLRRASEFEVAAKITVPEAQRPATLTSIKIETA